LIGQRYEIQAPLAKGGQGSVYSALDRFTRERVALKLVTHERRERGPASALSHRAAFGTTLAM
jgi:serine/threonine protein kinase